MSASNKKEMHYACVSDILVDNIYIEEWPIFDTPVLKLIEFSVSKARNINKAQLKLSLIGVRACDMP